MSSDQPLPIPSNSYEILKVLQAMAISTDWLTYWLMPLAKRNSIMAIATGLIFSLFSITSSLHILFHQQKQLY